MEFILDLEPEADGRWIAEIPELPGVLAYGATPNQAGAKAKALALRVLAERMEEESSLPDISGITFTVRGHEHMALR
jgi:predicted RNase H-like HicB family nuclease